MVTGIISKFMSKLRAFQEPPVTEINNHKVKKVVESRLDSEQVTTAYKCVNCGEKHKRGEPIVFSHYCDGYVRAGGHITRTLLVKYQSDVPGHFVFRALEDGVPRTFYVSTFHPEYTTKQKEYLQSIVEGQSMQVKLYSTDSCGSSWRLFKIIDGDTQEFPSYPPDCHYIEGIDETMVSGPHPEDVEEIYETMGVSPPEP